MSGNQHYRGISNRNRGMGIVVGGADDVFSLRVTSQKRQAFMRKFANFFSVFAAAGIVTSGLAFAQAPAPAPVKVGVTGLMHAIHSTNDVEKTLAFYQAVFGVGGQVRPFASTGPQI